MIFRYYAKKYKIDHEIEHDQKKEKKYSKKLLFNNKKGTVRLTVTIKILLLCLLSTYTIKDSKRKHKIYCNSKLYNFSTVIYHMIEYSESLMHWL